MKVIMASRVLAREKKIKKFVWRGGKARQPIKTLQRPRTPGGGRSTSTTLAWKTIITPSKELRSSRLHYRGGTCPAKTMRHYALSVRHAHTRPRPEKAAAHG